MNYQTHKVQLKEKVCNRYKTWEQEYDIYLVEMYSFTKDINISFEEFKMIIYLCSK